MERTVHREDWPQVNVTEQGERRRRSSTFQRRPFCATALHRTSIPCRPRSSCRVSPSSRLRSLARQFRPCCGLISILLRAKHTANAHCSQEVRACTRAETRVFYNEFRGLRIFPWRYVEGVGRHGTDAGRQRASGACRGGVTSISCSFVAASQPL